MSDTTEPTTGEVPAAAAPPPVYMPRPKRVIEFSVPMLIGTLAAVIVLGFLGGLAAQALFPAKQGATGHTGKQGVAGPAGPTGATGSAANINLSAEGVCYNVSYNNSGTVSFVDGVSVYTPTVNGTTKSCPSGNFVPLEPVPGAQPAQ